MSGSSTRIENKLTLPGASSSKRSRSVPLPAISLKVPLSLLSTQQEVTEASVRLEMLNRKLKAERC